MITFDFKDILEASSLFFATCNIAAKYPSKKKRRAIYTMETTTSQEAFIQSSY